MERDDGRSAHLGGENPDSGFAEGLVFADRTKITDELLALWAETYAGYLDSLDVAYREDDFIYILRAANVWGGIASDRNLNDWRKKWFGLIPDALVRATRMSKEAQYLGLIIKPKAENGDASRLLFAFRRGNGYYNTTESIQTLCDFLGEEEYRALFGHIKGACMEDVELPVPTAGVKPEISIGATSRYYALGRKYDLQTQPGVLAALRNIDQRITYAKKHDMPQEEIPGFQTKDMLLLGAAIMRQSGTGGILVSRVQIETEGTGADRMFFVLSDGHGAGSVFRVDPQKFAQVCGCEGNMAKLLEPYDEMDERILGKYMRNVGKTRRSGRREREKRLRRTLSN